MFAGKALHCDCGYVVRVHDEAAGVAEIRRHAWEAHGIDLPVELALDLLRRAGVVPSGEHTENREEKR
jgi:hypothetical protein